MSKFYLTQTDRILEVSPDLTIENPRYDEDKSNSKFITFDGRSPDHNPFSNWTDLLDKFGIGSDDEYIAFNGNTTTKELVDSARENGYALIPVTLTPNGEFSPVGDNYLVNADGVIYMPIAPGEKYEDCHYELTAEMTDYNNWLCDKYLQFNTYDLEGNQIGTVIGGFNGIDEIQEYTGKLKELPGKNIEDCLLKYHNLQKPSLSDIIAAAKFKASQNQPDHNSPDKNKSR